MVSSKKKLFLNPIVFATAILIFVFYTPCFKIKLYEKPQFLFSQNQIKNICGVIKSSPIKQESQKYYSCSFELINVSTDKGLSSNAKGKIRILIPSQMVEAFFPGKLYSTSKSTINCIYEQGGTYSFDGIFNKDFFIVKNCIKNDWEKSFIGRISYFRALIRLQFKRLMYTWGKAGGFVLALLSGAKEYLDKDIAIAFRKSGLSHILALSGMHLSMFSGLAIFIGKKAKRKKLSFIIRIISLILFVWFAGFSPSLLRAFICASLVLFCSLIDIPNPNMFIILCCSFILQSMISPSDLQNIAFILSYGALSGIILFNSIIRKFYIKIIPPSISSSLSSSTSAQIFTVPISLKVFGSYSPIGLIATCFISPLITIFIYSSLFFIILSLIFPFLSNISAIFMNFLYTIIKALVKIFSKAPIWSFN